MTTISIRNQDNPAYISCLLCLLAVHVHSYVRNMYVPNSCMCRNWFSLIRHGRTAMRSFNFKLSNFLCSISTNLYPPAILCIKNFEIGFTIQLNEKSCWRYVSCIQWSLLDQRKSCENFREYAILNSECMITVESDPMRHRSVFRHGTRLGSLLQTLCSCGSQYCKK